MGFACSDARKRPSCIPPITRFSRSFEEISYVSFYTAGNQNVDFERKKENELRSVSFDTRPRRMRFYGRTKARYINRKIATITERGTSETLTISKLKITRRRTCEQIGFQKKWDLDCTPGYSDCVRTPGSSPTSIENVNCDDVFSISRPSSKMGSGETKSESSAISRSSIPTPNVLEIKEEKPANIDSVFTWENAANIKLIDIGPAGELTSSQIPG